MSQLVGQGLPRFIPPVEPLLLPRQSGKGAVIQYDPALDPFAGSAFGRGQRDALAERVDVGSVGMGHGAG